MVISLPEDANRIRVIGATSSADGVTPVTVYADPSTHRLKVDLSGAAGTVTTVTSNDGSILVTNPTTTPDLSVVSAPKLTSARTIAGVSFDGSANIAIPASGLSNGVTGSGAIVLANTPTLVTAVLGSSTATTQTPADNSTKVATTAYVDNAILGQRQKEAVKYASIAALPSIIYANGSSGVGATLTGVALAAISLDGASPGIGDRVLIKNQVSDFQNGIYVVTQTGSGIAVFILTRTTDFDQAADIQTGDTVFVTAGNTLANTTWTYNGIDSPTMGTTSLTFVQAAGPGSYTAGNGISITGVSIAIDTAVTVDKTTAQTLTNKTLTSPILTTPVLGTPSSGTLTSCTGLPAASVVAGTFGSGTFTITQLIYANNAITATSNAATVPITSRISTVTNSSAATLTITITTTSAVDGQLVQVRILDFSAVAQTITWVNTEDSTVTAPTTSNGSTTLPLSALFQYNSGTSKWRCIGKA